MDPVTAVGLAGSIVQFVQFTGTLISSAATIYRAKRDRCSEGGQSLKDVIGILQKHNNNFIQSLRQEKEGTLPAREQDIVRLGHECNRLSDELLATFEPLQSGTGHMTWDSLVEALRTMWSDTKIQSLVRQLDSLRSQVSMLVLMGVREDVRRLDRDRSRMKKSGRLEEDSNDIRQSTILTNTQATVQRRLSEWHATSWEEDVLGAIFQSYPDQPLGSEETADQTLRQRLEPADVESFAFQLLQKLFFLEMRSRQESIPEAYEATFRWIFRPPEDGTWADFSQWLESDDQMYWITGKAASGKSTIMKFILKQRRTNDHLRVWAGERKLTIASFYFWNAGTEMQLSKEGLARTLLEQLLRQAPHLVDVAFPQRLEAWSLLGHRWAWHLPWTWSELLTGLRNTVKEMAKTSSVFLFIDGLDEYGGQPVDIIAFIQSFLVPHVKMCVSSRPWNAFEDGFARLPSLRMEQLTLPDIEHFVQSNFAANAGFQQLQELDPGAAQQLAFNVAERSQGVFLWTAIVTKSLLDGLSDGEHLHDLQKRLDELPSDLEELFEKLLSTLDSRNLSRLSQILQIMRVSMKTLTLLDLAYADEDPEFALQLAPASVELEPSPSQQLAARSSLMKRRLNACCKGLVEVTRNPADTWQDAKVDYLHRTVFDYFRKGDIWSTVVERTDKSFDPYLQLLCAQLCVFKTLDVALHPERAASKETWERIHCALNYAACSKTRGDSICHTLLDQLDEVLRTRLERVLVKRYNSAFSPVEVQSWFASWPGYERNCSFIHLAVQNQLHSYVLWKLEEQAIRANKANNSSTLLAAVAYYGIAFQNSTSIDWGSAYICLVEKLLRHGADPNREFKSALVQHSIAGSFTPWTAFLRLKDIWHNDEMVVAGLTEAFLAHGADTSKLKTRSRLALLLRPRGRGFARSGTLISTTDETR